MGATKDATCIRCKNAPSLNGSYVWTEGCAFRCISNHWLNGTDCVRCSVLKCAPGSYASNCTGTFNDTRCLPCQIPSGSFSWTAGCEFECANGFFLSGKSCHACSMPACSAGKYTSNCTSQSDSLCLSCVLPNLGSGAVVWTSGCEYVCAPGYYKIPDSGCIQCSPVNACQPGTYAVPCSASTDARCAPCSSPACGSGFRLAPCSALSDAYCVRCPNYGAGALLLDDCSFDGCAVGYFRTAAPSCEPCLSSCRPGSLYVPCSNVSNARCGPCGMVPTGSFEWTSACDFRCSPGYYLFSVTMCVLPTDPIVPRVMTVVNASLSLHNTLTQVCNDMYPLTRAVNDALYLLSQGTTEFVTHVTSLDDLPCELNRCPQCISRRRSLLWETVNVSTSSYSLGSVPLVLAIPPPLPQQLISTLSLTMDTAPLEVEAAEAVVVLIPVEADVIPVREHSIWEMHGELIFLLVGVGPGVLMALYFLTTISIKRRRRVRLCGTLFVRLGPIQPAEVERSKRKQIIKLTI